MHGQDHSIGFKRAHTAFGRQKSAVAVALLILILGVLSSKAMACSFMALISQGERSIAESPSSQQYFNFLREKSRPPNNDGYGVLHYGSDHKARTTYLTCHGCSYLDYPDPMDQALATIHQPGNGVQIVLGHDRNGSGGKGSHPFTFDVFGKTFSFMHNGALNHTTKAALLVGLAASGWFDEHDPQDWSNWDGNNNGNPLSLDRWIDSELIFLYLISFIEEENGDVARGILSALSQTSYFGFNVSQAIQEAGSANIINFVLSDGEGLFVFKNSTENSSYRLWLKHFNDGLVGIKTGSNYFDGTLVAEDQLLHIPLNGSIIEFDPFPHYEDDTYAVRRYHPGSNWVCYPLLPNHDGTDLADLFAPLTSNNDMGAGLGRVDIQTNGSAATWETQHWVSNDLSEINATAGYKLTIPDDAPPSNGNDGSDDNALFNHPIYNHPIRGSELIDPETVLNLHAGTNYVPYFLEDSQFPSDAFPQKVLDGILALEAEAWFMIRRDGEFYFNKKAELGDGQDPEPDPFTLNFGEMVVVTMASPVAFTWNRPPQPLVPIHQLQPEFFTAQTKPDYTKVIIESIESMEFGESSFEIAAMKRGICVGAEIVKGFPINLRLYDENPHDLFFEVAWRDSPLEAGSNDGTLGMPERRTLGAKSWDVENGAILMHLGDVSVPPLLPSRFTMVSAWPNPFNPQTEIHFLLERDAEVTLAIYNIMGQEVAMPFRGFLVRGEHAIAWNGMGSAGAAAASGMYIYRLSSEDGALSKKVLLIR